MNDKQARELYNTLRSAMQIKEGWSLWEIAPKFDWLNLRENYIQEKIFKIGQLVENLNTGLVGKIIRRGTNYLICVTEDNIMFKSWIKDVVETKNYQEVPMKNLKNLVHKAVNRTDDNIDGFVDKDDKKVGPYGAFIPTAKNQGKIFRSLQKEQKLTNVSGVPADQREVWQALRLLRLWIRNELDRHKFTAYLRRLIFFHPKQYPMILHVYWMAIVQAINNHAWFHMTF